MANDEGTDKAEAGLEAVPDLPAEGDETELPQWEYEIDQAVYETPLPLDSEIFDPVALKIDVTDMEYSEWARIVHAIDNIEQGHHWWGGDAYNAGEAKWGQEIAQVLGPHNYATFADWGRTCDKFDKADRLPNLHYTHFKYARELDTPRARRSMIKKAVDGDWTTEDTRIAVKAIKDKAKAAPDAPEAGDVTSVTWTCSFRLAPGDEQAGDLLAERWHKNLEGLMIEFDLEPLKVGAPDKELNRRDAPASDAA